MTRCRTCKHPTRAEIEAALSGGEPSSSVAARYGLPRQTLEEHRKRHLDGQTSPDSQDAAPQPSETLDGARYTCAILRAQLSASLSPAARARVAKEYRAALQTLRLWEDLEHQRAREEEAAAAGRALDLPGVASLLDKMLASLSEAAREEVIEWIQKERNATDPDS